MALQTPSHPTVAGRSVRSGEDHAQLRRTIVSIVAMVAMLAAGFLLGRYLAPSAASVPAQPSAAAPPEAAALTDTRREVLPHPGPAVVAAPEVVAIVSPGREIRPHPGAAVMAAPATGPGPVSHSRLGPVHRAGG